MSKTRNQLLVLAGWGKFFLNVKRERTNVETPSLPLRSIPLHFLSFSFLYSDRLLSFVISISLFSLSIFSFVLYLCCYSQSLFFPYYELSVPYFLFVCLSCPSLSQNVNLCGEERQFVLGWERKSCFTSCWLQTDWDELKSLLEK